MNVESLSDNPEIQHRLQAMKDGETVMCDIHTYDVKDRHTINGIVKDILFLDLTDTKNKNALNNNLTYLLYQKIIPKLKINNKYFLRGYYNGRKSTPSLDRLFTEELFTIIQELNIEESRNCLFLGYFHNYIGDETNLFHSEFAIPRKYIIKGNILGFFTTKYKATRTIMTNKGYEYFSGDPIDDTADYHVLNGAGKSTFSRKPIFLRSLRSRKRNYKPKLRKMFNLGVNTRRAKRPKVRLIRKD